MHGLKVQCDKPNVYGGLSQFKLSLKLVLPWQLKLPASTRRWLPLSKPRAPKSEALPGQPKHPATWRWQAVTASGGARWSRVGIPASH